MGTNVQNGYIFLLQKVFQDAARCGKSRVVTKLFELNPDPNYHGYLGRTPLIDTVESFGNQRHYVQERIAYEEVIRILLSKGADPKIRERIQTSRYRPVIEGENAWEIAEREGHTNLLDIFKEHENKKSSIN